MEFSDLTPQQEVSAPITQDPTSSMGEYHDAELGNFLSRPIRIASLTWNYGTAVNGVIDPWYLFFTDTRVKNRLAYYNLLKCKLCVKFVINGNAFQYGKMLIDYLPLFSYAVDGVTYNDTVSFVDTTSTIYPNAATHRQNTSISPLDSQGVCMELPFYWPKNFMSIPLEEWKYMGKLRYYSLNPVLHANNASATDPPIVSIFAWAEDVKISVPTSAPPLTLLPQAGTEVVGAISGPATALSKVAGSLAKFPIIGSYARATQVAAGAAAGMAKMFGYSRPPIETPITPMHPDYVGNIANTDRPVFVNKLTLDSSQEVTIDPSVVGVDRGDELTVQSIAQKETYLTTFTWDYSQGSDQALWHTSVTPLLCALLPGYTTTRAIYPTALAYATLPFKYWKGSLKFRFEVVASKFHKGRLRFVYDPETAPTVANFNQNYQYILDLDASSELTVTANWCSTGLALDVGTVSLTSIPYGPIFADPDTASSNGALYVYVLNNLSVPSQGLTAVDCLAYINVYVSAGDDFEVFVPTSTNLRLLTPSIPFTPSAGEEIVGSETWEIGTPTNAEDYNLVLFGEKIVSFRTLLKRYSAYIAYYAFNSVTTSIVRWRWMSRILPLFPGSDSSGIHTVTNLEGGGTFPGNYISMSLLQYLQCAYSGFRGAVRYKYVMSTTTDTSSKNNLITARRNRGASTAPISGTSILKSAMTFDNLNEGMLEDYLWSGAALCQVGQNPHLEVEVPYYEKYRFLNPKSCAKNDVTIDGHDVVYWNNTTTSDNMIIRSYVSTGEDFNLLYYTGPPVFWSSSYYNPNV